MKKFLVALVLIFGIHTCLLSTVTNQNSGFDNPGHLYISDRLYIHSDKFLDELSNQIPSENIVIVRNVVGKLQHDSRYNGKSLINDYVENRVKRDIEDQVKRELNSYKAWAKTIGGVLITSVISGIAGAGIMKQFSLRQQ